MAAQVRMKTGLRTTMLYMHLLNRVGKVYAV
jgi:hypothetical protein